MKLSLKITSTLLLTATLLNLSCKKDVSVTKANKSSSISAAISKQIVLAIYNSLSSGVGTVSNKGIKAGSVRGPVTMDASNPCGQVVKSSVDKTYVSGDTTRTTVGSTAFTYLCDGYYNNNWNIDAYRFQDTLTVTDKGAGFKNIYHTAMDYKVKSLSASYNPVSIYGYTIIQSDKSKITEGVTTELHNISTQYKWDEVGAQRNENGSVTYIGEIQFSTFITDRYANDINDTRPTDAYSGYIQFLANNMVKASFNLTGNETKDYLINLTTGEVTEL